MFSNFYSIFVNQHARTSKKTAKSQEIVWFNVLGIFVLHIISIYALYLWLIAWRCQFCTVLFQFTWAIASSFGITGGAHRLWAHRSYKATRPLKILYVILMSMIFANDIYTWVRDHRTHHKFSETNADPHNVKRGFFFSHCGWLMVKRHPEVLQKGQSISYKDLEEDGMVMFHRKYYIYLMLLGTFVLPTVIPWYWGQELSFIFCTLRYAIHINMVWSLNSFAHLYGSKPYEKNIYASENQVMMYLTIGEGFHNYHHVFPWDYKAAEFGNDACNLTTYLINFFAWIGWAYELKMASSDMIQRRALRTGDGTWAQLTKSPEYKTLERKAGDIDRTNDFVHNFWGWDDPDISDATKQGTLINK